MTTGRYVAGLLAALLLVAGCSSKPSSSVGSVPAPAPASQSTAASASTSQVAPSTGLPGSGSNHEAEGRLDCQTLNALGVNSQSVSMIVDGSSGMSKDAATAQLVELVHLYCPSLDDQLQQVTGN